MYKSKASLSKDFSVHRIQNHLSTIQPINEAQEYEYRQNQQGSSTEINVDVDETLASSLYSPTTLHPPKQDAPERNESPALETPTSSSSDKLNKLKLKQLVRSII